jgi:hypothetical protein
MDKEYTYSRKLKRAAVAAVGGFALVALFYKVGGGAGHGCELLDGVEWLVLEILHPVMVAGWQAVQAYVADNSRLLQHLPQVTPSIWTVLCFVVG